MKDLRDWIAAVEAEGDLKRISTEVDWELELAHIATLNERQQGPALLFEKVKDYNVPILASTCSTPKRMAITCGRPSHYSLCEVAKDWKAIHEQSKRVDPVVLDGVPSTYDVIEGDDINLWEIPVPRMYPQDGGRYFGLAVCFVTEDPETGWTNLGTYRAQVLDEKTLGCNIWIGTKHGKHHIDKFLKSGKTKMPIAVYCGCDIFHFVAGSARVPEQHDEYGVIGAMMGEPVEVFKSDLSGLKLPAHAEYVLEGELELDEANWRPEGPLGEYVGYYGASGAGTPKPTMTVKRMYRRKDPIFVITTVGRPIGDTHIINTITLTAALWADLETMKVPGIKSVYVPPEAAGRFWAIVSAKIAYPAHAQRILEAVACSPTGHFGIKGVIVVDDDVPADDMAGVWWSLACRYNPVPDTQMLNKMRPTPFDPSLPIGHKTFGSVILIDATIPIEWEKKPIPVVLDEATTKLVVDKWQHYGFDKPYPTLGGVLPR